MASEFKNIKYIVTLMGLSCLVFILGKGILSLSNPNEVFYAQTAKEMVRHNSWMTPYLFGEPQFEKPILLYWRNPVTYCVLRKSALEDIRRCTDKIFQLDIVKTIGSQYIVKIGPRTPGS